MKTPSMYPLWLARAREDVGGATRPEEVRRWVDAQEGALRAEAIGTLADADCSGATTLDVLERMLSGASDSIAADRAHARAILLGEIEDLYQATAVATPVMDPHLLSTLLGGGAAHRRLSRLLVNPRGQDMLDAHGADAMSLLVQAACECQATEGANIWAAVKALYDAGVPYPADSWGLTPTARVDLCRMAGAARLFHAHRVLLEAWHDAAEERWAVISGTPMSIVLDAGALDPGPLPPPAVRRLEVEVQQRKTSLAGIARSPAARAVPAARDHVMSNRLRDPAVLSALVRGTKDAERQWFWDELVERWPQEAARTLVGEASLLVCCTPAQWQRLQELGELARQEGVLASAAVPMADDAWPDYVAAARLRAWRAALATRGARCVVDLSLMPTPEPRTVQ